MTELFDENKYKQERPRKGAAKWLNILRIPYTERMLVAIALAVIVGYLLQGCPKVVEMVFQPMESICLFLLKIIVVPLMVISVVSTIVAVKLKAKVGKLLGATFCFFFITTVVATLLSLVIAMLMDEVYPFFEISRHLPKAVPGKMMMERIADVFVGNLRSSVTSGSVLLFLTFAFACGFVLLAFSVKKRIVKLIYEKADMVIRKGLVWYRKLAPVAMFFLFTPVVASYGSQLVGTYAALIGACYICYLVQLLVVYLPSAYFWGNINPFNFCYGMVRPLMFAMTSESSIATIPFTIHAVRRMGVRNKISCLVMPLGGTFNMDGSAIYLVVSSIFVASCYGIDLTFGQYLTIGVTSTLLSFCVVGIPGGSLALLPLVFAAAGIPLEGIALVAVVDRLVDMGRTVISVTGDATTAVVLEKWLK